MTTTDILTPAPISAPRGHAWAADAAAWMLAQIAGVRARRSARLGHQRVIDEANAVRRLARQLDADDPRAAADLYAAADRHERF